MTLPEATLFPGRVGHFRVVIADFDGTLTEDGRLSDPVIEALGELSEMGIDVILATGRILSELREAEPRVEHLVDAVVAENGCVLSIRGEQQLLARKIDPRLEELLRDQGIAVRRGEILLAGSARDEGAVLDGIRSLGEEYQLVRNRTELMVLPAGVNKGSGALAALAELGHSGHSAIGIGDAENDHSLFEVCELGVAVSNAVESLRLHADVVLGNPDGPGVSEFLSDEVASGHLHRPPSRWRILLGHDTDGDELTLPASQMNILLAGGTGAGKSYCSGLIAEQLIRMGYSVLVIDPEGDHRSLGNLPNVTVLGASRHLAAPDLVVSLLGRPGASVVIDLSDMDEIEQAAYMEQLPAHVESRRARTGQPHWVIADEAQRTLGASTSTFAAFDPTIKGHIFVTWRPEDLPPDALASVDVAIAFDGDGDDANQAVNLAAAIGTVPARDVADSLHHHPNTVVVTRRTRPGEVVAVTLRRRSTPHLRHEHKYDLRSVNGTERFFVWNPPDWPRDVIVSNLSDLASELARCPKAVIAHHCGGHDYSRWIREVVRDARLATSIAEIEQAIASQSRTDSATIESVRLAMVSQLRDRLRR